MTTCPYCSGSMAHRRANAKTCGAPDCDRARKTDYMREWQRNYAERNGISYVVERYDEQRRAYRASRPKVWDDAARERKARREALKSAPGSEVFDKREVFERDEWTCGLCGESVDPDLVHPDPMSASLDHIVPLAQGGPHTRENAQCTHLTCNVSRPRAAYRLAAQPDDVPATSSSP